MKIDLTKKYKMGVQIAVEQELIAVAGKLKKVPADASIIKEAKMLGVSFGD